jgi:hypothetical protein
MYHSAAAIARLHGDPRNSVINADFCCTCAPQHWLVCASALGCLFAIVVLLQQLERSGEPAKLAIGQSLIVSRRALILSPSI